MQENSKKILVRASKQLCKLFAFIGMLSVFGCYKAWYQASEPEGLSDFFKGSKRN